MRIFAIRAQFRAKLSLRRPLKRMHVGEHYCSYPDILFG
jgi:hypothetical protein